MKKVFSLLALLLTACSGQASVLDIAAPVAEDNLIIVGEGGTSGRLFTIAAMTYQKNEGGVIYEVSSGREFTAAVRDFYDQHGEIRHLEYFGHGNNVGLYVNQEPGVNGGLYANDPNMNEGYRADSIYGLDKDLFYDYGWIRFNGCNVADGYPEQRSLAQDFANYFEVTVVAPTGPTEFDEAGDEVFMIATYDDEGFETIEPQVVSDIGFWDVRVGQNFEEAVRGLSKLGLALDFEGGFQPYKNITYAEAFEFCRLVADDTNSCYISGYDAEATIRNLQALRMLLDASGVETAWSDPWYQSYVDFGRREGILTEDFTGKKWYTRGDMAELTWNLMRVLDK